MRLTYVKPHPLYRTERRGSRISRAGQRSSEGCGLWCRVHISASVCYTQLGERLPALLSAVSATSARPEDARAWLAKMNAERNLGNIAQAVRDAEHAATLSAQVQRELPGIIQGVRSPHGWHAKAGKVRVGAA